MVAHQEKELQRLAKENAEKFLLKHAVIGSYLNLNKKIANQYKVNISLEKTAAISYVIMQPPDFLATFEACRMSLKNASNVFYGVYDAIRMISPPCSRHQGVNLELPICNSKTCASFNKAYAITLQWTFELKHEEEGPCGKRRRGNSGQTQPDHDGQDPGPIPMGQLVDPASAAGPWMPLHSIAEAEALKLTSVPPVLQRNSAPTPGETCR